jgi:hypothetical protein
MKFVANGREVHSRARERKRFEPMGKQAVTEAAFARS